MRTIKRLLVLVTTTLTFSQQVVADDWFMPTPLASVYSALAMSNTQLAWQEMQQTLGQKALDERFWEKTKQIIISRSQCGKQLIGDLPFNQHRHITLIIQKKTNLVHQSYQLKVSLDGVEESTTISLRDQQGRVWISDNTAEPEQGYVELESDSLVYPPMSGFYQLTIGQAIYPIILSSSYEQPWIKVNRSHVASAISIQVPKTLVSCQPANMRWQWFNDKFSMLGNSQPIQLNTANLNSDGYRNTHLPAQPPNHAKWLSAVVSQSEYQGAIKIEYAQRFTFPATIQH
ncbi:DUF2861 family protein [Moritella sp. 5]|uniref:DUF2861 family protein n=1 Tax=Moritella sp. 5 TaxID=2746231 RepID=UPI001BAA934F|nr:DUF2861 family protein [Moritella sp. 5]QUM79908.1 DUF2861 family protein [Moritella sp. 5]